MPPRVMVQQGVEAGEVVELDPEESHHLVRVQRARAGDPLWIILPEEGVFEGILRKADPKSALVEVGGKVHGLELEPPLQVTVVMPFVKGERTEWAVQKLTEIGVTGIRLARFERSVVTPQRLDNRLKRLNRIAMEAVKQAVRVRIPRVEFFGDLMDAVQGLKGIVLVPGAQKGLSRVFEELELQGELGLCIGPEGGLTQEERSLLRERGWIEAGLGPRVLRTETAAVVASAITLNNKGDLGCS